MDKIWPPLEAHFRKDALLAQIYLLVNGQRSQRDIVAALEAINVNVHEATVSRRLAALRDLDLIQLLSQPGPERVYAPTRLEKILRLKRRAERLLTSLDKGL